MRAVRVSPRYEVRIPKDVCRSMNLKPGMRFRVREFEYGLELIPMGSKRNSRVIPLRTEGKARRGAKARKKPSKGT